MSKWINIVSYRIVLFRC